MYTRGSTFTLAEMASRLAVSQSRAGHILQDMIADGTLERVTDGVYRSRTHAQKWLRMAWR
jgi:Mn-dependent DtxR family transcriptional regulator